MFIYITLFTIFIMHPSKGVQKLFRRVRSLVVSDLRPETKGSRFESGCWLCAEVSSPQQSLGQCLSACEAGESGNEEIGNTIPIPLQSCDSRMLVKENPG